MIHNNVDQWEILREFPDYTWRALQERYAYNFGDGLWYKDYKGKKPYNRNTRWRNTAEYQSEQATSSEEGPQVALSMHSTDRCLSVKSARDWSKLKTQAVSSPY
jgi:hypothetical protein